MLHLPQNLRLIRLLSGKTQTEFGKKFNATKAMIISYEKGKANPDELFITRVAKFAGVSGQDLMMKRLAEENLKVEKEENVSQGTYTENRRNHKLTQVKEDDITVYQIGTKASFIDIYEDNDRDEPVGKLNSSVFPGCNYAERISGSSMYPMIFNQAMVVGERLMDAKGISSGEIYVIHTKRGLRTCKYVHTIEKKPEEIRLVALNKNVPPQVIPIEDITLIMRVYFIINPS